MGIDKSKLQPLKGFRDFLPEKMIIRNEAIRRLKPKMESAIDYLDERLKNVRTGRAQASLVEDIQVTYYGSEQPLKNVAQIMVPESNLIVIQPFDRASLGDIRLAILNSDLGLNPTDDGFLIRISVPPLTEERRIELIKFIKKIGEETRISLRNHREETWKEIKKAHKDKIIADDKLYLTIWTLRGHFICISRRLLQIFRLDLIVFYDRCDF